MPVNLYKLNVVREMLDSICNAFTFATEKHKGQVRRIKGEPYAEHCDRVSGIVAAYLTDLRPSQCQRNTNTLIAAILHDTLEDTETTYEELTREFGLDVAEMVLHLTNDEKEMAEAGGKKFYLAKKINGLTSDELLIKLADRLDNIADLTNDAWSQKYADETRYIFLETLSRENLTLEHTILLTMIEERVTKCENSLK